MQVYRVDASVMMKHSAKFFVKAKWEDEAKRFVGGNINSLSHEFEPDDFRPPDDAQMNLNIGETLTEKQIRNCK